MSQRTYTGPHDAVNVWFPQPEPSEGLDPIPNLYAEIDTPVDVTPEQDALLPDEQWEYVKPPPVKKLAAPRRESESK
jgi:hypothetical protein